MSGRRLFTADPQKVEVKTPFAKMATAMNMYTSFICVVKLPMFMSHAVLAKALALNWA